MRGAAKDYSNIFEPDIDTQVGSPAPRNTPSPFEYRNVFSSVLRFMKDKEVHFRLGFICSRWYFLLLGHMWHMRRN